MVVLGLLTQIENHIKILYANSFHFQLIYDIFYNIIFANIIS